MLNTLTVLARLGDGDDSKRESSQSDCHLRTTETRAWDSQEDHECRPPRTRSQCTLPEDGLLIRPPVVLYISP